MTTDTRTSARTLAIALRLAPFVGLLFIGTAINNDAWFLLNCGRYVESYGIPHIEPFTLHEGWHYVMQQWLFAFGLWNIYSAFGTAGLIAVSYAAGAIILFLFQRLVRLTADGNCAATFAIIAPVGICLGGAFFCQRPQVVSTAAFIIEIYLLERYKNKMECPHWLYPAFFALSVLVVNCHAAMWPMLLVFILPYLVEALFGARLAAVLPHDSAWTVRRLAVLLAILVAGGFVNPYGIEGVTYTTMAYGNADVQRTILEMQATTLRTGFFTGIVPVTLCFALAAAYVRRPVPLRHLLLAGGTMLMALLSVRSLMLFYLFATFPLARALRGWHPGFLPSSRRSRVLCAVLLAANVALFGAQLRPVYQKAPVPPSYAAAADELVRLAEAEGRAPGDFAIYTGFNTGSYLEFRGFRCYMDGRAEVFLPALNHDRNVFHEYVDLQNGRTAYEDALAPYAFDALAVDRGDLLYAALAHDDAYTCIWDSETAGIAGEGMRIYRKK